MLDVICTHHPLSRSIAHHLMCYPLPLAETGIHPGTIAAQDGIRGDKRPSTAFTALAFSRSNWKSARWPALSCTTITGM